MAFLAIPAVASWLGGGALGTAGAAALSGAALGAAGSEAMGGDWEDGALKGALGAGGGALFGGLLGAGGAAGEATALSSAEAAALGDGALTIGETAGGLGDAAMNMDLAAAAAESLPASEAVASAANPWAEFGLEATKDGATNVLTTGAMQAATPEQTVSTPVAPPPPIDINDEQLMEFMRQQMQMDPARMQLQPLTFN